MLEQHRVTQFGGSGIAIAAIILLVLLAWMAAFFSVGQGLHLSRLAPNPNLQTNPPAQPLNPLPNSMNFDLQWVA